MSPQKLKVRWFLERRFSVTCSMVMKSTWKISGCSRTIFRPDPGRGVLEGYSNPFCNPYRRPVPCSTLHPACRHVGHELSAPAVSVGPSVVLDLEMLLNL